MEKKTKIIVLWLLEGYDAKCDPKTAYGNAEMRTLRLHIKLLTVRGFTNKKNPLTH